MKYLPLFLSMFAAGILAAPATALAAKPANLPVTAAAVPAKPAVERILGLMPDDLVQVAILLKNDPRVMEKHILELRVCVGDKLEIRTGFQTDRFTTRGNLVILKKTNNVWSIISVLNDESGV